MVKATFSKQKVTCRENGICSDFTACHIKSRCCNACNINETPQTSISSYMCTLDGIGLPESTILNGYLPVFGSTFPQINYPPQLKNIS